MYAFFIREQYGKEDWKKKKEIRHFLLHQCMQGFKGKANCVTETSP